MDGGTEEEFMGKRMAVLKGEWTLKHTHHPNETNKRKTESVGGEETDAERKEEGQAGIDADKLWNGERQREKERQREWK